MLCISKTTGQHSFFKFIKLIYIKENKKKENQRENFLKQGFKNLWPLGQI